MKEGYAINPQTSRIIKKSTAKYKRLLKLGLIVENEPTPETKVEPEPEKVSSPPEPVSLKSEIAKTTVNIVKENINSFRDLNKEDTDKLLRQLLIDKLCLKKPTKSKTKSKFKLKPPPPSSESESESDSN